MLITKDMGIMEIVQKYPATVEVLQRFGMGCIGCAAAHFENIEQGALAHGIDVPALMDALNDPRRSLFYRLSYETFILNFLTARSSSASIFSM